MYQVVIAKYKEDISWSKSLNPIIYDKSESPIEGSIPLPNIGREGHTFLHHIVENYDNLPEYTVFLQGMPFDHMFDINPDNIKEMLEKVIESKPIFAIPALTTWHTESPHMYEYLQKDKYFEYLFNKQCPPIYKFAAGAQYIMPRPSKPKTFFQKILDMSIKGGNDDRYTGFHDYKINAWQLERYFGYIFNL
jgi:hypothetical protein